MAGSKRLFVLPLASLLLVTPAGAGPTWKQIASPNSPGSNELLGAGAADASQVWAVGRVVNDSIPDTWRSLVLRWDGNAWSSVAHPHFPGNHLLQDTDAPVADDAWSVGYRLVPSGGGRTVVEHGTARAGTSSAPRTPTLRASISSWG